MHGPPAHCLHLALIQQVDQERDQKGQCASEEKDVEKGQKSTGQGAGSAGEREVTWTTLNGISFLR